MDLQAQVVSLRDVTHQQRDAMFQLMDRYYAGMKRDVFETDLNHKDWIIQIADRDTGIIRGFSTQVVWDVVTAEGRFSVLFSGDTIVDHRCWGNNPLAQTWGRFALSLIDEHDRNGMKLFWFLIVKGYKTYRFLPLFFHEFYPQHDASTTSWARHLIHELGTTRFPSQFESQTGIIRASAGGCRLRSGVADITPVRMRDPHVRFFVTHNPGHANGNELCCIAPLTRENFTSAARRVIGKSEFSSTVRT